MRIKFQWLNQNLLVVVLILTSLVLGGCIPKLGPASQSQGTGEYLQGKIVKGFPSLPLYPKAQVLESYGDGREYGAAFITKARLEKVVKFYDEALRKLQWETVVRQQSPNNFVFEIKNAQNKGNIIVNTTADDKKTAISIFVSPRQ